MVFSGRDTNVQSINTSLSTMYRETSLTTQNISQKVTYYKPFFKNIARLSTFG